MDGYARRFRRWMRLDGRRTVVSACITLAGTVGLFVAGWTGAFTLDTAAPVTSLAGSVVGPLLPFVTVVLAVNQFVLTQEFGAADDIRDRLEAVEQYRRKVREKVERPYVSERPDEFLRQLLEATREAASELRSQARPAFETERRLIKAVDAYVERLHDEAADAEDALASARQNTFEVVTVILDYQDQRQRREARRIRTAHDGALPDPLRERFERLESMLEDVQVARQYFKTVYVQQELADLSCHLLYAGSVAIAAGCAILFGFENLIAAGVDRTGVIAAASIGIGVLFSPFAVLFAYALRIATVARRTTADFGPFALE